MNEKDYIDVDFVDVKKEQEEPKEKDVTIRTDPLSIISKDLVGGFFGSINTLTSSIKEYNMCKQQEQTKRNAIKAQMKVQIEAIQANKEKFLKLIEEDNDRKMAEIEDFHNQTMKTLDIIQKNSEVALKNGDNEMVLSLMQMLITFSEINNRERLRLMEMSGRSPVQLSEPGKPIAYIE